MAYVKVNTLVDVEVDIEEFEDDDLKDKLESRGYSVSKEEDVSVEGGFLY